MLHGMWELGLLALGLTVVLGLLWLSAVGLCIINFRNLGLARLVMALTVPPFAWNDTLIMVNRYPAFINRIYFRNHREDYVEAVRLARAGLGPDKAGTFKLPPSLRQLSIDGEVEVWSDYDGRACYDFSTSQGLMRSTIIRFAPLNKGEAVDTDGERLGGGWYLCSSVPD